MSAKRIIVVGDVMLDVVVRPHGPIAMTSDTASTIRIAHGGSGANIAVALGRSGHDVTYVGAVGDDVAARTFGESLTSAGVRPAFEVVDAPTGVVVSMVARDAERAMLTDRGANRYLTAAFVLEQTQGSFDHLHISGYTLLDDETRAIAGLVFAQMTGHGTTSVDVCSVAPLAALKPGVFLSAARGATWLFANEEEALTLAGTSEVERALESLAAQFDEVVVTRGVRGVIACSNNVIDEVDSVSRDVVDTTGAGDAATGAYLGARLHAVPVRASLEAAMRASAQVVAVLGARDQSRW